MHAGLRWLLCLVYCLMSYVAHAEDSISTAAPLGSKLNPITVGVLIAAPFSYKDGDRYYGLAIEYWESIANHFHWHYRYIDVGKNYDYVATGVDDLGYDIAIGNYSSTYKRTFWVNFTPPYILNNVAILVYSKEKDIFTAIFMTFFGSMLPIVSLVFGVFILASILFWYLEKAQHRYAISESMFSTSIAMLSGNVIDTPSNNANKFVFICILLTGVIIQAMVVATLTEASLRIRDITDPFMSGGDLNHKHFIVEAGSSYVPLVYNFGGRVKEIEGGNDVAFAYYLDHKDEFDGYIIDKVPADYFKNQSTDKALMVSQLNLRNDILVFFYNKKFIYQDKVGQQIHSMQENGIAQNICSHYIGPTGASLCVM